MRPPDVTLLIVEDDAMVRGWMRLSLRGSEFRIIGEAASAVEAVSLVERRRPDLLLIDFRLGDAVGTELLRELRHDGVAAPAVVMTAHASPGFNESVRQAGGQGTVLKTGSAEELLEVLRTVGEGGTAFDFRHPRREPGQSALSPRERDVLRLVARGATNSDIAQELGVRPETVKTLIARMFAKLGVRRRAEAVAEAHRLGLL